MADLSVLAIDDEARMLHDALGDVHLDEKHGYRAERVRHGCI